MTELVIAALIANEQVERQFAAPPRQTTRPAVAAAVAEPRAPVRRTTVRVLRVLADRLEPAPRCVRA
jgi:hypothetical protein